MAEICAIGPSLFIIRARADSGLTIREEPFLMASGSTVPGDSNAVPRNKRREIPSGYIEDQLERTSSEVRLIELSISILTLCVATLSYLLVLGIFEHWFIAGGLSTLSLIHI